MRISAPLIAVLLCLPALARAGTSILDCRAKDKSAYALRAVIDLSGFALTLDAQGEAPRLVRPVAGTQDIDSNCPKAPPMSTTLNYTVSSPRFWGQEILQLPKDIALRDGRFEAKLWTCEFDGAWNTSYETALDCGVSTRR